MSDKVKNDQLFAELKELCEDQSHSMIETVTMGIEESFVEVEADFYGCISTLIFDSLLEGAPEEQLLDSLDEYDVWNSENLEWLIDCIHEGATFDKIPEDHNLDQNSSLLELVIYALKITL